MRVKTAPWRLEPFRSRVLAREGAAQAHAPVDEIVRVRDRYQFEIKLVYRVPQDSQAARYDIDAYFFVPPGLGITRDNYTRSDFYDDLQAYVRLRTPSHGLDELVFGAVSPLSRLTATALRLRGDGDELSRFEHELKIFCCTLSATLGEHVEAVRESADPERRRALVDAFCAGAGRLSSRYRDLREVLESRLPPRSALEAYRFGDEWISLLIEDRAYDVLTEALGDAFTEAVEARVLELVRAEVAHRRAQGYPSIPDEAADNEQLLYRYSVLKRYVQSVLLLNARKNPSGRLLQRGAFGLLKETLRRRLPRHALAPGLYDHKAFIFSSPRDILGSSRESVDFIDNGRAPEEVLRARNRDHMTEIEDHLVGEQVVRYRKTVALDVVQMRAVYGDVELEGLNDIVRFNVAELVRRAGRPRKTLYALADGSYRKVKADRVYHLNVVLSHGSGMPEIGRRYRVVLNRRGIKRIDTVRLAPRPAHGS